MTIEEQNKAMLVLINKQMETSKLLIDLLERICDKVEHHKDKELREDIAKIAVPVILASAKMQMETNKLIKKLI